MIVFNFRRLLFSVLCLSLFNLNSALNISSNNNVKIIKVNIGQMVGDDPEREFSTIITLTNGSNTIQNWQFGFYMPRKFKKIGQTNKNLAMKICEKDSNYCSKLIYQKSPFLSPDLSIGFTTVLAPQKQFLLKNNKTYIISLLHNNQFPIFNYSGLPQSFFINNKDENNIINIETNEKTYNILHYNSEIIKDRIHNHVQKNWVNSASMNNNILNIIPSPIKISIESGNYQLNDGIIIQNFFENDFNSKLLQSFLKTDLNISATIKKNSNHNNNINKITIQRINFDQINNNPEGYKIIIDHNSISIMAGTNAGIFYAIETLRQLFNQFGKNLPILSITDYPRFKYRGILLDVSRHFFTTKEIKQFIDIMATHKLNTLHLHLSDDDAFRLFLPQYPQLTTIGSIRGFGEAINGLCLIQGNLDITNYTNISFPTVDTKVKGYYNTQEVIDLIQYANARQITIIPEIDIPAHARAIIKAIPEALFDTTDKSPAPNLNENTIPVCTYNTDSTLGKNFTKTINDIVLQIAKLFNNQTTLYQVPNEVSIGGDEVNPRAWVNSLSCNGVWKNLSALQKEQLFLKKLSLATQLSNVKLSGWHEFVQHDNGHLDKNNIVSPNKTAHVWTWRTAPTGIPSSIKLANNNYKVVLDYAEFTYFDLTYTPDKSEPGLAWATNFSDTHAALKSAIAADSTVNSNKLIKPQNILGIEGALWTDVIPDYNHLIYMALPKMAGLSEASWSDSSITNPNEEDKPNWHSLAHRLGCGKNGFLDYLNKTYGVRYRGYPNGIALEAKNCH